MTLPVLDAERLRLRPLGPGDVPALLSIFGDPEVCRYWSSPPLSGIAEAEALYASIERGFETRTLFQWGTELCETKEIVGTCTLASVSEQHRRAEVGFALGRAHWRKGYATEALVALLGHAFSDLALHRLEADVDPRNRASMRVLERLGFERDGYLRERYHVAGEITDGVLLGLLRPRWERLRPGGGITPASPARRRALRVPPGWLVEHHEFLDGPIAAPELDQDLLLLTHADRDRVVELSWYHGDSPEPRYRLAVWSKAVPGEMLHVSEHGDDTTATEAVERILEQIIIGR